jgi:4'-phosphopantetheinyl transferase
VEIKPRVIADCGCLTIGPTVVMASGRNDTAGQAPMPADAAGGWMLPAGEVHVWRASLEQPVQVLDRMRRLLSPDERARAESLRFVRDRARFTVGRARLRELLARYVDVAPENLNFHYGEFRKPALAGGPWFNLSHSGAVALYAFSSSAEVGIDVELDDGDFARERIAERFFSPAEVRALRLLPLEDQPRAFLACWTRKEAFIKARGDGLNLALDSFDVTLAPHLPAAVLRTAWCGEEASRWRMEDLSDRKAGYIAAVAIRGERLRVVRRELMETIEGGKPGQEKL